MHEPVTDILDRLFSARDDNSGLRLSADEVEELCNDIVLTGLVIGNLQVLIKALRHSEAEEPKFLN